jgi:hypothetical protein
MLAEQQGSLTKAPSAALTIVDNAKPWPRDRAAAIVAREAADMLDEGSVSSKTRATGLAMLRAALRGPTPTDFFALMLLAGHTLAEARASIVAVVEGAAMPWERFDGAEALKSVVDAEAASDAAFKLITSGIIAGVSRKMLLKYVVEGFERIDECINTIGSNLGGDFAPDADTPIVATFVTVEVTQ